MKKGFTILKLLGKGGFSSVYLVQDRAGAKYACKVSTQQNLLETEAFYMQRLEHPLFPRFFDAWQEDGQGFLLMEYIPGENLTQYTNPRFQTAPSLSGTPDRQQKTAPSLSGTPDRQQKTAPSLSPASKPQQKSLSISQIISIGSRLADGLATIQDFDPALVYRDVKPANCILMPDGRVRLLDLGLICPVGENPCVAGTPGFAAPEQLIVSDTNETANLLTPAADIYGLGRTLRALLPSTRFCSKLLNLCLFSPFSPTAQFMRLLELCTEASPQNRLQDMRTLRDLLVTLEQSVSPHRNLSGTQRAIIRGTIRQQKSVVRT